MGSIFKTPKVEIPNDPTPSASDEESRRAAELERRKRGRQGRQTTILTQSRRLGVTGTGGRVQKVANRPTILGS